MYIISTYNRFVGDGTPKIHTCFIIFILWGSWKACWIFWCFISM